MPKDNKQGQKNKEKGTLANKRRMRERIIAALQTFSGSKLSFNNETDRSITRLETIVRTNPNDTDAWMNLGRAQDKKFQFLKAIESKLNASNLSPFDPEIKFSLGCSYCAQGDFSSAIKSYLKALKCKPDFAEACEALSEQYRLAGEEEKADEWFLKGQEIRLKRQTF